MTVQRNIEKLKKYGKKTISKDELSVIFAAFSDEELYQFALPLIEKGILQPIKTAKTNGNRKYPLYLKYKIVLLLESYHLEQKEIAILHPLLQKSGYLQAKPEEYKKYRDKIQKLDHYLFYNSEKSLPISRKERSF